MTSKRARKDERRCPTCGGAMRYELASLTFTVKDRLLVLKSVPVWGCRRCDEKVLTNEVAKQVEKILEAVKTSPEHYHEVQFKAA